MQKRLHRICCAAFLLAAISTTSIGQIPPARSDQSQDPLHMLVLGDSIMWGQGLKETDKFWWRVKGWLKEKTGRDVRERIEAHSGAAIEADSGSDQSFTSSDGEVNLIWPTVNQQVDSAIKYYGDPSTVDLVLVNGCINDVGVRNLLDPSTEMNPLAATIREKCGARMERLLRRVTSTFKNAHVLVTNYYTIISPMTGDIRFTRMLANKLLSQKPEAKKPSDRELREKLSMISQLWYQQSTQSLRAAVEKVSSDLKSELSSQKILFAEIQFAPEHAFSAPDTLLWNFMFGSTNLSGLRKAIVVLTLGTAAYKPNDDLRDRRNQSCKQTYKRPAGVKETKLQKEYREDNYLACRYASLGHPNKMGALVYTEAIKGQLQWLIQTAGWIRKSVNSQAVSPN